MVGLALPEYDARAGAQNDLERELYEDRLKAKRDLQTLETLRDQWQQRYLEAENRLALSAANGAKRGNWPSVRSSCPSVCCDARCGTSRIWRSAALTNLRDLADRLERNLTV